MSGVAPTLGTVMLALSLCACAGGEGSTRDRSEGESLSPIGQVPSHSPPPVNDGPLDSAAIAEAMAAADIADADAARDFETRKASMASREQCLRQAASLPAGPARQRIEAACELRP